jgi:peptidoglycan/xylan/chitin deacetylase (PgdA/CDA1 family)
MRREDSADTLKRLRAQLNGRLQPPERRNDPTPLQPPSGPSEIGLYGRPYVPGTCLQGGTKAATAAFSKPQASRDNVMRASAVAAGLGALVLCVGLAGLAVIGRAPEVQTVTESCAGSARALGVSRVLEIDTTSGPRFGHQQYHDIEVLEDGEIVLTFDDGPLRAYTQPVLEALAAHCTKATFFMVGRMALADPEMVREVAQRGHTIGAHTWSHRNLKTLSPHQAEAEVELGFSAVKKAVDGPIAPFFRFPYLSEPRAMITHLEWRNIAFFSINVDAYDYRTRDPGEVHRAIVRQLLERRKGILLFHDIQPSTALALRGLLDELEARGFKVVHFVPRSPAATLAKYDAIADQERGGRRLLAVSNPMARQAVYGSFGTARGEKRGRFDRGTSEKIRALGPEKPYPLAVVREHVPKLRSRLLKASSHRRDRQLPGIILRRLTPIG